MSVCGGCLSRGRTLSCVQPAHQLALAALLSDNTVVTKIENLANTYVCWECTALLNKILQFKLRAARAQEWLQWAHGQGDCEVTLHTDSLSSLQLKKLPSTRISAEPHTGFRDVSIRERDTIKAESKEYLTHASSDSDSGQSFQDDVKEEPQTYLEIYTNDECKLGGPPEEPARSEWYQDGLVDLPKVNTKNVASVKEERANKKKRPAKVKSGRKEGQSSDMRGRTGSTKGMQYGYMYKKMEMSDVELWRMRNEEKAEVRFVSATHRCEACVVPFRSETMLKKHLRVYHSEKLHHACDICSKTFGTKAERDRHQKGHYFCYKCNKCELIFLSREAVCRHYKKDEHNDPEKSHSNIEKVTDETSSQTYIKHPSIHKDYRCHICNKMFTFKGNFTKHVRLHSQKLQYPCSECNKGFSKPAYLAAHMLTHTGERPHHCNLCTKTFSLKGNLKQHMLVHTLERRHQCEICSKCFSQGGSLKQHMVTHTREKAYKCEVCDKSFTMKQYWKQHMLFHTGELPHQCDICSKRFGLKSKLERHMLIHTGGKPYQCNLCNKSFAYKATLKQHMILHTCNPKHQCEVCKKCFTQAKSLRLHMTIHTGERPYGCEVCGKRFSYEQALRRHIFTHTGEQPHGCDVCGKRFSLKANLKMHVTKVHKVQHTDAT